MSTRRSSRKSDGKSTDTKSGSGTRRRRTRADAGADAPASPASDTPAVPARHVLCRLPLAVRWRDLDAFHHVNNATFLTYIEEARLHWFQSLDGPWVSDDIAPVLAAAQVAFRRPIEWPASLTVELEAERVGNSSLTLAHRIVDASDAGIVYCEGNTVLVWIDRRSGRPAGLPEAVRRACAGPD